MECVEKSLTLFGTRMAELVEIFCLFFFLKKNVSAS